MVLMALDETSRSFENSDHDFRKQQELKSNSFQPQSSSHYKLHLKVYPPNQGIHIDNVSLCAKRNRSRQTATETSSNMLWKKRECSEIHNYWRGRHEDVFAVIPAFVYFHRNSSLHTFLASRNIPKSQSQAKLFIHIEFECYTMSIMVHSLFSNISYRLADIDVVYEYELV